MKKEIEAFVNAANEQELEAAWNNLSAEEQRVFDQLMEEEPPEDALAFFAQLYDDAPKEQTSETVNISENEIYFKRKPLTEEQKKHSSYVDENGNLHVKNLSAFWIPELTTTEKVGHTTYTVSGSFEGRNQYIARLCRYPLLILDDFGMERGTDYGLEQVFNVIDSRYRSGKPLIVTTNLSLDELQHPQDTPHARIYDRLLEMCAPILFTGTNFRKQTAQSKLDKLKTMMKEKECL